MPVYMSQFSYTTEAWEAMARNPVDRRGALRALIEPLGGRLIELYYCFGDYDGVVLYEAPDDAAATAAVVAVIVSGTSSPVKTTKLLTVEEALPALRQAGELSYRPPSPRR
jgi:uncharacterized protein with GYD domain